MCVACDATQLNGRKSLESHTDVGSELGVEFKKKQLISTIFFPKSALFLIGGNIKSDFDFGASSTSFRNNRFVFRFGLSTLFEKKSNNVLRNDS